MLRRALPSPLRLALVGTACAGGIATYLASLDAFATRPHAAADLVGVFVLLLGSTVAQRYPVPIEGVDMRGVNVGFVFGVAAVVLFGWDGGVLVAATSPALVGIWERHRPLRACFDASVFALAAGLAGVLIESLGRESAASVALAVAVCSVAQYTVNLLLVTASVRLDGSRRYLDLIRSNVRWTALPFALMGATSLSLVVLWQRTPLLATALLGPLLAITLYQRSQHHALAAVQLALTDPLTGLGNPRHFHERLQRELDGAQEHDLPLTLCLLDVDDFKRINDRYGHGAGDRVLTQIASRLRQGGEAFRLGGDEFALLLPKHDEAAAAPIAHAVVGRIAGLDLGELGRITASAGVATFPDHSTDRDAIVRLADDALYWAKENGKNRVRISSGHIVDLAELKRLAAGRDLAEQIAGAARNRADDEGSHAGQVARIAAQIGEQLGLGAEELELTRLAAAVHDIGVFAIPEEILDKPGPLTDAERRLVERHPQIGFRMLESLGVEPIAEWVLHHHERWDGDGYPDRLRGDEIPLGARIIFVADAYDAMTSERVYRRPLSAAEAVEELDRCSGSQFDPAVVDAAARELSVGATVTRLAS